MRIISPKYETRLFQKSATPDAHKRKVTRVAITRKKREVEKDCLLVMQVLEKMKIFVCPFFGDFGFDLLSERTLPARLHLASDQQTAIPILEQIALRLE